MSLLWLNGCTGVMELDFNNEPEYDWFDHVVQPRCKACGRFAFKMRDRHGRFVRWALRCVSYDAYIGGWEHE